MRPKCRTGFRSKDVTLWKPGTAKPKTGTRCDYGSGTKLQLVGICYFVHRPFIYLAQILSSEHPGRRALISRMADSNERRRRTLLDGSGNAGETVFARKQQDMTRIISST
jgi:hypothetical protein